MPEERITIRARLIGARQYIRDMLAASAATRGLGTAADTMGKSMERSSKRSFLMNQTLFTMRRLLYNATLATGVLASAAGYLGYKFNASMERTTIALEFLGKGEFDAAEQMKEFLRIANETAFLPQQVIDIGQSFIAFGFTAEETNRTLRATGNAIAALNLPQETIHRMMFALGQIRVKGRVMGEELRQLANANIPAYEYLAQALGKNVTQLNKIGDARIPAEVGIEAIVSGLERQYGGASERIRETTTGQFEVLKGHLQAILGGITFIAFERFGDRLRKITAVTQILFDEVLDGNKSFYNMVRIVDDATGGTYHLSTALETMHGYLRAVWGNLKLVVDVLTPFFKIAMVLTWVLLELTTAVFNFIHLGGQPLVWVLRLLVAWMILERISLKLITLWTARATAAKAIHAFWTRRQAALTRILFFWKTAETVATKTQSHAEIWNARTKMYNTVATKKQTFWLWRLVAATWAYTVALLANPLAWIVLAVLALAAGLAILYWKFEGLRTPIELIMIALFPLIGLFILLNKHVDDLSGKLDKLKGSIDWIENLLPSWGQVSALDLLGGGSSGGVAAAAVGAPATPQGMDWNAFAASGGGGGFGPGTIQPAPVIIDGRQLAEIVFKHRADRIARQ